MLPIQCQFFKDGQSVGYTTTLRDNSCLTPKVATPGVGYVEVSFGCATLQFPLNYRQVPEIDVDPTIKVLLLIKLVAFKLIINLRSYLHHMLTLMVQVECCYTQTAYDMPTITL